MEEERLSLLALHFVPGVGDFLLKQLVAYCGSASEVFKMRKDKLQNIPGIGPVTANSIFGKDTFKEAEHEFKMAEKFQSQIITYTDKQYPARLKEIEDSPAILFTKGNINFNTKKIVAIVGTRKATEYGKSFVEKIIEELVPHSPIIISGLAYGIDIQAHKQALKRNLNTVGVLGSGLDRIYPATHNDIANKMLSSGGLISEQPFGTKPDAHNFPARNRIIAGLCDALIVVEAAISGGALITAEIANSYNKDVFALPGNYNSEFSTGCNWLIKTSKANLISSVKDIEYIMNWSAEGNDQTSIEFPQDLSDSESIVLKVLRDHKQSLAIDELTIKAKLGPSELANGLLTLELKGLVKSLPGKQFKAS